MRSRLLIPSLAVALIGVAGCGSSSSSSSTSASTTTSSAGAKVKKALSVTYGVKMTGVTVHLVDEGPHALFRELAHGVAEHPLLFAEVGEGKAAAGSQRLGHRSTSVSLSLMLAPRGGDGNLA